MDGRPFVTEGSRSSLGRAAGLCDGILTLVLWAIFLPSGHYWPLIAFSLLWHPAQAAWSPLQDSVYREHCSGKGVVLVCAAAVGRQGARYNTGVVAGAIQALPKNCVRWPSVLKTGEKPESGHKVIDVSDFVGVAIALALWRLRILLLQCNNHHNWQPNAKISRST